MEGGLFGLEGVLWPNLVWYRFAGIGMKFCPECGSGLQQKIIDGFPRLACEEADCHFVYWNNPVPVVAALVAYEDNYVIARHVQWPADLYSVITGYLEAGETPEQAVVREVKEELGLDGQSVRHIGNYAFYKKNQLILAYEVQASGIITSNHELAEVRYLSASELAEYDFGPLLVTKRIVQDWRKFTT